MQESYIIYTVTVILASFFAWMSQIFAKDKQGKFKLNKIFLIISMMILIIVMGYRTIGVGVDDATYVRIFQRVSNIGVIEEFLNNTIEPRIFVIKLYRRNIYK